MSQRSAKKTIIPKVSGTFSIWEEIEELARGLGATDEDIIALRSDPKKQEAIVRIILGPDSQSQSSDQRRAKSLMSNKTSGVQRRTLFVDYTKPEYAELHTFFNKVDPAYQDFEVELAHRCRNVTLRQRQVDWRMYPAEEKMNAIYAEMIEDKFRTGIFEELIEFAKFFPVSLHNSIIIAFGSCVIINGFRGFPCIEHKDGYLNLKIRKVLDGWGEGDLCFAVREVMHKVIE